VTRYAPDAHDAIQALFDYGDANLAELVDAMIDILDTDPGDIRVRRFRAHEPPLWIIKVHVGEQAFWMMWDLDADGEPHIRFAGLVS